MAEYRPVSAGYFEAIEIPQPWLCVRIRKRGCATDPLTFAALQYYFEPWR